VVRTLGSATEVSGQKRWSLQYRLRTAHFSLCKSEVSTERAVPSIHGNIMWQHACCPHPVTALPQIKRPNVLSTRVQLRNQNQYQQLRSGINDTKLS
jgi:hypothetical protein